MTSVIPHVSKLFIYPIKALDSFEVKRVSILRSGAIKGDREWAIFDESGGFVNGKRHQPVHALRSQFALNTKEVFLSASGVKPTQKFELLHEEKLLSNWLSEYFGFPVHLKRNIEQGFPDDTVSPGPTIISTATLEAIASWYPGLEVEEVRRRFRANIEIAGVPPFWEDRLFREKGQTVDFLIGKVRFMGVNPCQRCVVVTRDSRTGEAYPNFQKTLVAKRWETLPEWAQRSQFNHFFRVAVNTRVPVSEERKEICLGDEVTIQ